MHFGTATDREDEHKQVARTPFADQPEEATVDATGRGGTACPEASARRPRSVAKSEELGRNPLRLLERLPVPGSSRALLAVGSLQTRKGNTLNKGGEHEREKNMLSQRKTDNEEGNEWLEDVKLINGDAVTKILSNGQELNNLHRDACTRKVPIKLDEDSDGECRGLGGSSKPWKI